MPALVIIIYHNQLDDLIEHNIDKGHIVDIWILYYWYYVLLLNQMKNQALITFEPAHTLIPMRLKLILIHIMIFIYIDID